MAIQTFNIVLQWAKMLTPHVRHLAFAREDGVALAFTPGQFINIHIQTAAKLLNRSYSVATIAGSSREIEIACSYVEGGIATQLLANSQPGDKIVASGPYGRLILHDEQPARYILVATGTGITPYRAMLPQLKQRLKENNHLQVIVLEGVRQPEELLYREDFVAMMSEVPNFNYHACYSRIIPPTPAPYEKFGRVLAALHELNLQPQQDIIYLCGNPNMIDDCFDYLKTLAFAPASVRREKYISGS